MHFLPVGHSSLTMLSCRHFARSRSNVVYSSFRKLHESVRLVATAPDRHKTCRSGPAYNFNPSYSVIFSRSEKKLLRNSSTFGLGIVSQRNFSFETYNKYFSPEVAPIGFAQKVLEGIHTATGLPWWASIALSTVALRGIITLPIAVYSMHVMARVELLQPEIMKLSQELRREVAMAVKKFGWNEKYARFKYNSTMRNLIRGLYMRDNCHPAKSSLVIWFQIPMWVCMSFALRNMSGAVPVAPNVAEAPVLCPDLKTEGTLWFPDLTAPDSTWILPVALGVTNLLNIEMHTLTAQRVTKFHKGLTFVMRLLSVIMVPIGAVVPSCMCYYWVCSSVFGFGQNVLFKMPSVRRLLQIPQTPSESQTPFQDLVAAAKTKYIDRPKQIESKT